MKEAAVIARCRWSSCSGAEAVDSTPSSVRPTWVGMKFSGGLLEIRPADEGERTTSVKQRRLHLAKPTDVEPDSDADFE